LSQGDINRGLVLEGHRLAGLLSITDLARALEVGGRRIPDGRAPAQLACCVVADRPPNEQPTRDSGARPERPPDDLAAEAERARTPRTPLLALTGVWLAVAAVVVVVLAVALTLYFVYGGR
jgi:hypothetical protein